jgi:hypothetical protein
MTASVSASSCVAWRRPSNAEERRCWPVVEVAGRPSKATHIHTHTHKLIYTPRRVGGRRGIGAILLQCFQRRTYASSAHILIHIHTLTYTHTPIEAHHAQCRRQGHASVRRPAGNRPTNNRGRHARPVASMRTKGGTSWRSRKRERVSAWRVGSAHSAAGLRALATCSSLVCAP